MARTHVVWSLATHSSHRSREREFDRWQIRVSCGAIMATDHQGAEEERDFEERLHANVLYTFSVLLRKSMKSLLKTVRAGRAVYSMMTSVEEKWERKGWSTHTHATCKKKREGVRGHRIERMCVCVTLQGERK